MKEKSSSKWIVHVRECVEICQGLYTKVNVQNACQIIFCSSSIAALPTRPTGLGMENSAADLWNVRYEGEKERSRALFELLGGGEREASLQKSKPVQICTSDDTNHFSQGCRTVSAP